MKKNKIFLCNIVNSADTILFLILLSQLIFTESTIIELKSELFCKITLNTKDYLTLFYELWKLTKNQLKTEPNNSLEKNYNSLEDFEFTLFNKQNIILK